MAKFSSKWYVFILEIILIYFLFQNVLFALLYFILVSANFKEFKLRKSNYFNFKLHSNTKLQLWCVGLVLFNVVLNYIISYTQILPALDMQELAKNMFGSISEDPVMMANVLITFIKICIVGPIIEEIIFRHYLLNRLTSVLGGTTIRNIICAVIIGAFIFCLGHGYQGPVGYVHTFLMGIGYGGIYFAYNKNLTIITLLHMLKNLLAFIALLASMGM